MRPDILLALLLSAAVIERSCGQLPIPDPTPAPTTPQVSFTTPEPTTPEPTTPEPTTPAPDPDPEPELDSFDLTVKGWKTVEEVYFNGVAVTLDEDGQASIPAEAGVLAVKVSGRRWRWYKKRKHDDDDDDDDDDDLALRRRWPRHASTARKARKGHKGHKVRKVYKAVRKPWLKAYDSTGAVATGKSWRCSTSCDGTNWADPNFNDSGWKSAAVVGKRAWGKKRQPVEGATARWITAKGRRSGAICCRGFVAAPAA